MLIAQKLFDKAARRMLHQGRVSLALDPETGEPSWACAYRGPDGLVCAVGGLIDDEHYSPELEGHDARHPEVRLAVLASLGLPASEPADADALPDRLWMLLEDLQYVHDNSGPANWPRRLRLTAEKHGLSSAVVDELKSHPVPGPGPGGEEATPG